MADNKKNPRNPQSTLYKRLTRLLSTPLVNRRTQLQRRYRRADLDKYNFNSAMGLDFKKTSYNPYDNMTANIMANQNRYERYIDFDQMEYTPEIASALDIYADEMTTSTNLSPMIRIKCPNDEIKLVLENLYSNILNIDSNLFGWSRSLCKFGDFMLYLDIDDRLGIRNVISLPIDEVERIEGEDKTNPNYIQYQWNSAGLTFENWQVAHFRILGNDKYAPYGTSILEPARRIWRQLHLLEDAMMSYRITRSPERRVFYVDVGNIAPQDVEQYMQKVVTTMKKNQIVDSTTGRVDLRYNPLSIDEDYFIPVRGGENTRIESLPGGSFTGDIDDVKYLRDKLFSALKIPQSYLSRGDGADEDKATLAQKDIRFARTIQRLQRSVIAELEKVGIIHLYTLGYRGEDLTKFKLRLNNPSQIASMQELEHLRAKFEVADTATEGYFSKAWIYRNIFRLTEEEVVRIEREMFHDSKLTAAIEAAGEAPPEGGGGGGDLGGDDFGDEGDDLGDDDLGGDEGGDEPDSALLAAPGKRDGYVTPGSKGKVYHPEKVDSRPQGARKRSTKSKWSDETASFTPRNTMPGMSDLKTLSRGIYEEKETTYSDNDEKLLLEVNQELADWEVKALVKNLEKKNNKQLKETKQ